MADETTPETVDVWVVWAYDSDADGPDMERINTVESVAPDVARQMIQSGEARRLDDPRNVDDGYVPEPKDDPNVDLETLTRDQLRDMLPDDTEPLPANAKKADLIAAVEKARDTQRPDDDGTPAPAAAEAATDSEPPVTDMTTDQ